MVRFARIAVSPLHWKGVGTFSSRRYLVGFLLALGCRAVSAASCPAEEPHGPFVVSPGVELNYKAVGDGPRTLVAIHGFGASLDTWNDIAPLLEETHRYRIFMIDMLGFGESSRSKTFSYSIQQQADTAAAFVECVEAESGARVSLVGHSYGGSVAMGVLGLLKDRNAVDHLILIDALGFPNEVHFPLYINILRVWGVNYLLLNLTSSSFQTRLVINHLFYRHALVTKDRVHRYAQYLRLRGSHRALIKTAHQLGNKPAAAWLKAQIGTINVPTLIIWGSHDRLIPRAQGDLIHQAILSSKAPVLVDTGHVPQEELPGDTAQIIEAFYGGK